MKKSYFVDYIYNFIETVFFFFFISIANNVTAGIYLVSLLFSFCIIFLWFGNFNAVFKKVHPFGVRKRNTQGTPFHSVPFSIFHCYQIVIDLYRKINGNKVV